MQTPNDVLSVADELVSTTASLVGCAQALVTAWAARTAVDAMVDDVEDAVVDDVERRSGVDRPHDTALGASLWPVVVRLRRSRRLPPLVELWAPDATGHAPRAALARLAALGSVPIDRASVQVADDLRVVAHACAEAAAVLVDAEEGAWRRARRVVEQVASRLADVPVDGPVDVPVDVPADAEVSAADAGRLALRRARAAASHVLATPDLPPELCVPPGVPADVARRLREAQRLHAQATWQREGLLRSGRETAGKARP